MTGTNFRHIAKYLISCVLLFLAVHVNARVFEAGEKLYFNGKPSGTSWWMDHTTNPSDPDYTRLWAYFYNGSSHKWIEAHAYGSTNFYVEVTTSTDWTNVILTRHRGWVNDPSFDGNCLNRTGDISFGSNTDNYIQYFSENKSDVSWWVIAPSPSGNPASWTLACEDEQICTSAENTLYLLTPKGYDYNNSKNHAWFKFSSGSWTRLDGAEFRENEGSQDYTVTLDNAYSDTYYFLQAGKPSACRLIRIRLDQDCSPGAPGACKITSFIAVASEANVTDSTCAVDGLVAFDDKVNAGDLIVWCDDVDTVIFANSSVETPQTFKLKGFEAKIKSSYTLHAKFLNGTSECESTFDIEIKPPSAPIVKHDTITRFTKEDVTLTPKEQVAPFFQWTNSINDEMFTEIRNHTFTGQEEEMVMEYVFMATNEPAAEEGNLISNGTFEKPAETMDPLLESDYDSWGRDNIEYYGEHGGASGGYAITENAKTFWHDYQNVTAHEGDYFGLFDSKISDGSDEQAAWIARSGAKNPKLKVMKGVSYLFSFWVANINTYHQMNNGARLQFQISYDGGSSWNNLGNEINLGNFKDSNWHGRSSIATPNETSENVVIRVINLNHSNINIGNDFALDDIRFEAVTSHSSNISAYERFPVKYIECKITGATFEQPLSCRTTKADVNYVIHFVHPRGDLYIYEGEKLLAHIPHSDIGTEATSYSGVLKDQPVDNKKHELTVYFKDDLVQTDAPEPYFYDSHAIPDINIASLKWGSVTCDEPTVTLTAVINYTNQNGNFTAKADGIDADPAPTDLEETDVPKQITLTFPGLTADGKTGHQLHIDFDGPHGCPIDSVIEPPAPYMPQIKSITAEILPYECGDEKYKVQITVNFANSQNHDLIITDEGDNEITLTSDNYSATEASWTFEMPWEFAVKEHTFKAYFKGAEQCKDEATHLCKYTVPAKPSITVAKDYIDFDCEKTTYTLQLDLTYTNQKGTKFFVSVDGETPVAVTNPHPNAQTENSDVTLKVTGLLADGKTNHTYRVWTDNTEDCKLNIPYKAPFAPVISNITATPRQMGCEETEYDVVVTFDVTNGQDSMVTVWCKADKYTTFKAIEGTNTVTFEKVKTDAEKEYIDVWFAGAVNCKDKHHVDYKEPVTPHISVSQGPDVGDIDCDKTTYTVKFDVAYTNQNGKLYAWIDDDESTKKEFPYKENQATEDKVTIALQELPGDGLEHTIHVKFDGEHSCELPPKTYKAPFAPTITEVDINRNEMKCGETTFKITVTATLSENAIGHKLIITGDTGKDEPIAYNITGTDFKEEFIIDRTKATGEIYFSFEKADNCGSPQKHTYALPKVPALSINPVTIPEPTCDQTTFDLEISGSYTYLHGSELQFLWDGEVKAKQKITSLSDVTPVSAMLKGLVYDGKNHVLTVQSNESTFDICSFEQKDIEVPFSPAVKSTSAEVMPYVCGATNYQVKVTVEYSNAQDHDLIITDEAGHEKRLKAEDPEYGTGKASWTFEMPWEDPVTEHTFKAFFDGETECKNEDSHKATYTAPKQPKLTGDTTAYYCQGHPFEWYDNTYTADVIPPTHTFTSKLFPECDSIVTLHLHFWPSYTDLEETAYIYEGGDTLWNGILCNEEKDYTAYLHTVHGCDSTVTLHLNFADKLIVYPVVDTTTCEGTPVEFYGKTYDTSNSYKTDRISGQGADPDTIYTLNLTVFPTYLNLEEEAYICEGSDTLWNDIRCNEEKDYTAHLHTIHGCDSIVTLHLHFWPSYTDLEENAYIYEGSDTIWNGIRCNEKKDYTAYLHTIHGCDSIVTLHLDITDKLIVYPVVDTTTCEGVPVDFYGKTYDTSNSYKTDRINGQGADPDTVYILNLTVYPTYLDLEEEAYICEGSDTLWNDIRCNEEKDYTAHLHTIHGCDSIVTLHLHFWPSYTDLEENAYIYEGSDTIWNGIRCNEKKDYTAYLHTVHGCDSIVTLHLDITDKLIVYPVVDTTTCEGVPVDFYGKTYDTSNSYKTDRINGQGADPDTVYILNLTVYPTYLDLEEEAYICEGSDTLWNDIRCNEEKDYTAHLHTIHGCDSIVTLHLHFWPSYTDLEENAYIYEGSDTIWNGIRCNEEKDYTAHLHTIHGCDSIVTLHLDIREIPEPGVLRVKMCPGESMVWCDETIYPTEDNHVFPCDIDESHTQTLIVEFYPIPSLDERTTDTTVLSKELPFEWEGDLYTLPGHYEKIKTTDAGDESCIYTVYLDLTVLKQTELISVDTTTCEGTPVDFYGKTYDTSGSYETDTIKGTGIDPDTVYTLNLIVYPTYNMPEETATIIDGETYTWNGTDYDIAGVYPKTLETIHKCDSNVTLNLTVLENIVENVSFNIAEQCAGEGALEIVLQHTGYLTDAQLTFSEDAIQAGFENDTFPIKNDTVIVPYNVKAGIFSVGIDLWFHSRLKYSGNAPFTLLFPSSVLEQGWMDAIFVLTHNYNGGYNFTAFQWYKKGQKLLGETGPYLYQPLEVGAEYSAMLTEQSGLQLMTCPIIIEEHTDISLYPTVVTRREMIRVSITQNARLTMYSLMGEKVCAYTLLHGDTQIEAPGTQGIYLAEVVLESGTRKVIKIMVR